VPGLGFLDRRSPHGQFRVSPGGGGQGSQGFRVYAYKPYAVNVYARMHVQARDGGKGTLAGWGLKAVS
jgi:hypothetical protein